MTNLRLLFIEIIRQLTYKVPIFNITLLTDDIQCIL